MPPLPGQASAAHASQAEARQAEADEGDRGPGQGGSQDVGGRIRTFLGEFRMIIPALAALFGFQLTVAFQQSFADLPMLDRGLNFAGLACTGVAFLFLLIPASYHRFLAHQGETEEFLRFARHSIHLAFVFIPAALALSLYMQALRTFESRAVAAAAAATFFALCVVGWWLVPRARAAHTGHLAGRDRHAGGGSRRGRGRRRGRGARGPRAGARPRRSGRGAGRGRATRESEGDGAGTKVGTKPGPGRL